MRAQQIVIAVFTALMLVAVGFGVIAYEGRKHDSSASVAVYARSGNELWRRTVDDGYAVVIAVTSRAVLVAGTDDCVDHGPAEITLVTAARTRLVSSAQPCPVMRFHVPPATVRTVRRGASLVVTVPSQLGSDRVVSLPCPCGGGVHARVTQGTFVAGSD